MSISLSGGRRVMALFCFFRRSCDKKHGKNEGGGLLQDHIKMCLNLQFVYLDLYLCL